LAGWKRKYSSKANAKGWQGDEDAILSRYIGIHILFQPVPSGTMYKKIADSSYQVRMPSNAGFRSKPAVGGLGLKY
jgi:hypothetical protein